MVLWFYNCQTKHDSFARNSPISTVLTVECFLKVILSIYRFKRVNFFLENGIVESKTCKQYGRHKERAEFNPGLMKKSNDDWTSDVIDAVFLELKSTSILLSPSSHPVDIKVGSRNSEVGSQKSEVGSPKSLCKSRVKSNHISNIDRNNQLDSKR